LLELVLGLGLVLVLVLVLVQLDVSRTSASSSNEYQYQHAAISNQRPSVPQRSPDSRNRGIGHPADSFAVARGDPANAVATGG
jgi:hypothetical protein